MRAPDRTWDMRMHGGLLAGDETALAEVYDVLSPLVYGIALRSTGDERAAEDLTERVFLRAWERPMDFGPERGPLRVLLCELTRQWAVEHVRRAGRPARRPALVSVTQGGTDTSAVRDALLSLPAHQRNAILLAYFHGLSYRQVAQELDIPEDTARNGLHTGLDRLAELLAAKGLAAPGLTG